MGPINLPATVPYHASQMFSRNVVTLLQHLIKDGQFTFDLTDEITRDTLVSRNGEVTNPRVKDLLAQQPA
jgi:NAD(P) transhydrogenase subunit alpha